MAKTKKGKKAVEVIEDDDFVELDDPAEDDDEDNPNEGKLSAKEAAVKIGTDQRTLRKFLRKKAGKVGQGNRWLIDPDDLDELKIEFEASLRKPKSTEDKPEKPTKAKAKKTPVKTDEEIYGSDDDDEDDEDDNDEFEVLDEIDDL